MQEVSWALSPKQCRRDSQVAGTTTVLLLARGVDLVCRLRHAETRYTVGRAAAVSVATLDRSTGNLSVVDTGNGSQVERCCL
jgi:hypothetical protein